MPTASPSGPPYNITGLTANSQYQVRVRATNSAGASAWSAQVPFTTPAPAAGRATKLDASLMTGPYYTPIPADPVLDPNNTAKAATFAARDHFAGLQWVTVCFAAPGDPMYSVVYDADPHVQPGQDHDWAYQAFGWGRATNVEPVRIPDPPNFYPMPGGYADGSSWDGWGCVADPARGLAWAGWRMVKVGNNWQAATSHSFAITGDPAVVTGGLGRGDGLAATAGSITVQEVEEAMADSTDSYVIPHALAASAPAAFVDTTFRAPAVKTDGLIAPTTSTLVQGSRFYLPSTATTASSNRFIRAVTRTLKVYGIYLVDKNGSGSTPGAIVVNFERFNPAAPDDMVSPNSGAASTLSNPSSIAGAYYRAGLTFDFANLSAVPWSSIRLLRAWDGS